MIVHFFFFHHCKFCCTISWKAQQCTCCTLLNIKRFWKELQSFYQQLNSALFANQGFVFFFFKWKKRWKTNKKTINWTHCYWRGSTVLRCRNSEHQYGVERNARLESLHQFLQEFLSTLESRLLFVVVVVMSFFLCFFFFAGATTQVGDVLPLFASVPSAEEE